MLKKKRVHPDVIDVEQTDYGETARSSLLAIHNGDSTTGV